MFNTFHSICIKMNAQDARLRDSGYVECQTVMSCSYKTHHHIIVFEKIPITCLLCEMFAANHSK